MDYGSPAGEVLERISISNLARDYSHDILAQTVAAFFPYPNDLSKAKPKCNELIIL